MKLKLHEQSQENKTIKENMLKLESYSRRDNLVLDGIPESPGETEFNCYSKIVQTLKKMSINDPEGIRIVK